MESTPDTAGDSYRRGYHCWVDGEADGDDLPVTGELPEALRGLYAKNSPNPRFPPRGRYHWFDGDGLIHAVELRDGRARYRSRYVRTFALKKEEEAGAALWSGLLEPMDLKNPLGPIKDTANTDLTFHRGELVASWWLSGVPMAVSVPALETLGPCAFTRGLKGTVSAHPKVDMRTGEMMVFGFSIVRKPYYHYGVVSAEGELVHWVPLDLPHAHVPHDIAITPGHTVLLDHPLGWRTDRMASGKRTIGFFRDRPARFGVLPRHGGADQVRWFEAEPCYVYHTISAMEIGDTIEVVGCRIADPIPAEPGGREDVPRLDIIELEPYLHRWTLDLKSGAVREEQLDDRMTEFPRVDNRSLAATTRFSYNPLVAPGTCLSFRGVVKYDLVAGASTVHEWPGKWRSGEVVFAPRPDGDGEDDGWVVTTLTAPDESRSKLVVLEARDLPAGPVAEVELPRKIPLGFHAEWCPLD